MTTTSTRLAAIWRLVVDLHPEDVRRLAPQIADCDADALSYEVFGQRASAVLAHPAPEQIGDWREHELERQRLRFANAPLRDRWKAVRP